MDRVAAKSKLELWAGAECTVNRVGDAYNDQSHLTGHQDRPGDIDLLAGLGIDALRFPLLWERISPDRANAPHWDWSDERLARLREIGIRPIAGLTHHGSGPRHTSLVEPSFAPGLAAHALAVAKRYPWIDEWTPVNEPLTTARFAALYGHWYPHARDERSFWLALLNQIDAVRLSMQAIRSVNSAARLIQTDDLGRTYSTAALQDQSGFDNVRRWITWDLLCGLVVPGHELWHRLCNLGFGQRLRTIADAPCPPDVIGINHYLTSDRFLDHRLQRYPGQTHGGNDRHAFADVEAIRVLDPPPAGLRGALTEAWERYHLPIAATEVHNGSTREEQIRWLTEAWQTAQTLRDQDIDIRAVTAWAIFGNQGWNTLLTSPGFYESGAFDVSGEQPRETAIASVLRSLRDDGPPPPAVSGSGWWRRDIRLHHAVAKRAAPISEHARPGDKRGNSGAPLLIVGATGTLGRAMAAACTHRDLPFTITRRADLDLDDPAGIATALDHDRPWGVINAAGWVNVDAAQAEREACLRANADGAANLARACDFRGIPTVNFSSDLVFGGNAPGAFCESDRPNPLNVYGQSKALMENRLASLCGKHLIVRTAAFFSPFDDYNFAVAVVGALRRENRFAAADDCVITPTYVPDLCNAVLDLLIDGESGIWHVSNGEALSWAEFAVEIARSCGLDERLIEAVSSSRLSWQAKRPANCALRSERGCRLPPLRSAIERFAGEVAQLAPA